MAIKKKEAHEITRELNEIGNLVSHHWLEVPSLRTDSLHKISTESIQKILHPSNEADYKELLSSLRKLRSLENKEKNLGENEMLILVTKKVIDDRFLPYCEYGDGDAEGLSVQFEPLKKDIKKLHIIKETENAFIDMKIPEHITSRILAYLKDMNMKKEDCFYFMCYMFGFPQLQKKYPNKYDKSLRVMHHTYTYQDEMIAPENLQCGDAVTFFQGSMPKHHAIFLKDGLFISKLGSNPLCFNTLEQLHKIYETNNIALEKYVFDDPNLYQTPHPMKGVKTIVENGLTELKKDLTSI